MASLRRTVSGTGAGASLCLSAAAGAVSGRGMLPSLPVLTAVALVWSFAREPFTAVPDELAEPDRSPESLARPSAGTAGSLPAILRGNLWMGLFDGFWLCALPMIVVGVEVEVEKQGATCGAYSSVCIFMAVSPPIYRVAPSPYRGRHFTFACGTERFLPCAHGYLSSMHRHCHPC